MPKSITDKDGQPVNGKSIMGVLTLAAAKGTEAAGAATVPGNVPADQTNI